MNIITLNKWEAKDYIGDKNYIFISITEPKEDDIKILKSKYLKGILRVRFHDLDKQVENYKIIDNFIASKIAKFIKYHINDIECIVVNCHAGLSRSAGVSMAISDWLQIDNKYPFANRLVYRLVYNELIYE